MGEPVLEFKDSDDGPNLVIEGYRIEPAENGYILEFSDSEYEYKYVYENKKDLIETLKELL